MQRIRIPRSLPSSSLPSPSLLYNYWSTAKETSEKTLAEGRVERERDGGGEAADSGGGDHGGDGSFLEHHPLRLSRKNHQVSLDHTFLDSDTCDTEIFYL